MAKRATVSDPNRLPLSVVVLAEASVLTIELTVAPDGTALEVERVAEPGDIAVRIAAERAPVLVVDLVRDEARRTELVTRLRAAGACDAVAVVVAAEHDHGTRLELLDAPPVPIDLDALADAVRTAIERRGERGTRPVFTRAHLRSALSLVLGYSQALIAGLVALEVRPR